MYRLHIALMPYYKGITLTKHYNKFLSLRAFN